MTVEIRRFTAEQLPGMRQTLLDVNAEPGTATSDSPLFTASTGSTSVSPALVFASMNRPVHAVPFNSRTASGPDPPIRPPGKLPVVSAT